MTIRKTRIRNIRSNFPIKPGQVVYFGVAAADIDPKSLTAAGFNSLVNPGDTVLPRALGSISSFNALGKEIVRKDLPKEERVVNTVEWHWKLWDGTEQSRLVDIVKECYQREPVSPPSVELKVAAGGEGQKLVLTPQFTLGQSSEKEMVHAVNLILELFGKCTVFTEDLVGVLPQSAKKLNWVVLPPGEYPWSRVKGRIEKVIKTIPEGSRQWVQTRIETIKGYNPDFYAEGAGGFYGYVVFGFSKLGLYVLETIRYGNATYVFTSDWEVLSQLTKAQVLSSGADVRRVIHHAGWLKEINKLLGKEK